MPPVVSGRVRKSDPKQSASNSKARTKEDRIARRRAKAADDQLQWENQYLQGKPAAYFAGYDREVIPNMSPFVQVTSPFKGLGKIEFTAETDEPGWDFFRSSRGKKSNPNHHVFVMPHQHIERIIIIPAIPDGNLKWIVLIVPTAATGSSLAVRKYPKIIQFEIPETDLDGAKILRGVHDFPTFKNHLINPDKQEIVFVKQPKSQTQPKMFDCTVNLDKVEDSYLERGIDGILWDGETPLYFPVSSITFCMLTFSKESVRSGAWHEFRTVAVGLMIQAKEPFYEGEDQPKKPFLYFKDIQGFGTRRKHIEGFCAAHQINLQLVEQLFYSYDDNTPMGGWMPLNGDGYDSEDHGLESDPGPDPDPDVDSETDSEDDDDCVFLGAT
ncbi:uncharacterized protein FIESC28_10854 [Fusarium coffeatum]|uniref:Uncharacterized protein n=1 Tax=Fusarium coffeatum TaxID=231269 RepID=A0A366QSV7_9HYPO|nr:uncharacterized protein FIESC28_10854 [Fusarium coffeatum]RBR07020.1 hypothetical protein FIESC28_10854 [Fusarium coffeatum]